MFSLHETLFVCEPSPFSSTHLFSSIVLFLPCLISVCCPTSAHCGCCASFLTHENKPSWRRRESHISQMSVLHGCSSVSSEHTSISMLFVDSLLKWNGSDGASNVLFAPLESHNRTSCFVLLFFLPARMHSTDVCLCLTGCFCA